MWAEPRAAAEHITPDQLTSADRRRFQKKPEEEAGRCFIWQLRLVKLTDIFGLDVCVMNVGLIFAVLAPVWSAPPPEGHGGLPTC